MKNPALLIPAWLRFLLWVVLALALAQAAAAAPVCTISALPDTVRAQQIEINFTVVSPVQWDAGGGVGIYYRIPGETGWLYAATISGHYAGPLAWDPPISGAVYQFAGQVTDNAGAAQDYPHQRPAPQQDTETFYCPGCPQGPPPDCPPLSTLDHVTALAVAGFQMEPDSPGLKYYWTHPTEGPPCVSFTAEWMVDGQVSTIPLIPAQVGSTWSFVVLPYTVGKTQQLRVFGVDAENRGGPFSPWSEPFTDAGPPGAPLVPAATLIME
jgi:hypothetical protein